MPTSRANIRALDEITGDLARRGVLQRELEALRRSLPAARTRDAEAHARAEQSRAAAEAAGTALEHARVALAGAGFDAAEQHQLDDLWTTVVQVRSADADLARLADARQRLDVELQRVQRLAVAQDKALALATAAAATVTGERAATAALEAGQTRFHAEPAVRSHLHAGDACPVCLQTVVLMPPPQSVPELDSLVAAREEARRVLAAAQRGLQAAGEKRAAAAASVDTARVRRSMPRRLPAIRRPLDVACFAPASSRHLPAQPQRHRTPMCARWWRSGARRCAPRRCCTTVART